jgi:hypothetical protein
MASPSKGATLYDWLYTLDLSISAPVCLATHTDDVAWRWHTWYGHLGFHGLKLLF